MRARHGSSGFVISSEIMLIALVLTLGLITGWVKLRDQSLAEIKDTMAAIDAYIMGSGPLWQTGGTRWIVSGAIVEPSTTGGVTELWGDDPDPANWVDSEPAAELSTTADVYQSKDGFLVYGSAPTPSTTTSGAGEAPQ